MGKAENYPQSYPEPVQVILLGNCHKKLVIHIIHRGYYNYEKDTYQIGDLPTLTLNVGIIRIRF